MRSMQSLFFQEVKSFCLSLPLTKNKVIHGLLGKEQIDVETCFIVTFIGGDNFYSLAEFVFRASWARSERIRLVVN